MTSRWKRLLLGSTLTAAAYALPSGAPAPDFHGNDANGQPQSISQYKGRYIVLEWANQGCPYDRKHYLSGAMEALQKHWTDKGIVWLTVISSAPGQQGYVTAPEEQTYLRTMHAAPTAAVLDPSGAIGRLYGAKTTPHIFLINPEGRIVYQGAIDNRPTTEQEDLHGADNYLNDALNASLAGKPIANPVTRPYGCSVKYGD